MNLIHNPIQQASQDSFKKEKAKEQNKINLRDNTRSTWKFLELEIP